MIKDFDTFIKGYLSESERNCVKGSFEIAYNEFAVQHELGSLVIFEENLLHSCRLFS